MSEPATAQTRHRRVYLFGARPDEQNTVQLQEPLRSDVLAFLQGQDVPLTPELANALRLEFTAQEQFRVKVYETVIGRAREYAQLAGESIKDHAPPIKPADVGTRAYAQGMYFVYAIVATDLVEAINAAMAEVMPE